MFASSKYSSCSINFERLRCALRIGWGRQAAKDLRAWEEANPVAALGRTSAAIGVEVASFAAEEVPASACRTDGNLVLPIKNMSVINLYSLVVRTHGNSLFAIVCQIRFYSVLATLAQGVFQFEKARSFSVGAGMAKLGFELEEALRGSAGKPSCRSPQERGPPP